MATRMRVGWFGTAIKNPPASVYSMPADGSIPRLTSSDVAFSVAAADSGHHAGFK